MDLNNIKDEEILYRVVRESYPDAFVNGKPTAALFMDEKGASVDRDGGRTEEDIIASFKRKFAKYNDYKTSVKIGAGECRKIGAYLNPIGNGRNNYHAEIQESDTERVLSLAKALQLSMICREVC